MNGFWGGCFEKCFTDIRVFNPPTAFNLAIENMSLQKRELMSHVSGKWSTVLSNL